MEYRGRDRERERERKEKEERKKGERSFLFEMRTNEKRKRKEKKTRLSHRLFASFFTCVRLHLRDLLVGAEAGVGLPVSHQLVHVLPVQGRALGLAVRAVRATFIGALVPLDAHPGEVTQHRVLRLLGRAGGVGVLDAEDELAADVLGEEVVEERGAGAPDVEVSRGGGGEADAGLGVEFLGEEVGSRRRG